MKKRNIKICATVAAAVLMCSAAAVPASAASKTFDLYVNETSATGSLSSYQIANLQYAKNYATSHDGVNIYIDYKDKAGNWINTHHNLVEPGKIYGSLTDKNVGKPWAVRAPQKTTWRGVMNSWWWNGKDIRATSKFHAYN